MNLQMLPPLKSPWDCAKATVTRTQTVQEISNVFKERGMRKSQVCIPLISCQFCHAVMAVGLTPFACYVDVNKIGCTGSGDLGKQYCWNARAYVEPDEPNALNFTLWNPTFKLGPCEGDCDNVRPSFSLYLFLFLILFDTLCACSFLFLTFFFAVISDRHNRTLTARVGLNVVSVMAMSLYRAVLALVGKV